MTSLEREEINRERSEIVTKSNNIIQKSRYSLSATEQKLLIFFISKIATGDEEIPEIKLTVKEFCEVCNISYGGESQERIKKAIQDIRDKSWWMKNEKGEEKLYAWLDTATISGGSVTIRLSESLAPHLLQLKNNFTKYDLINILTLKGKYSIRLYEILKSYLWVGKWEVDLDALKDLICCDSYSEFRDFNRRVLKKSVDEVNSYTDLSVTYKTIRLHNKVSRIAFKIEEKMGIQLSFEMLQRREERMGSKKEDRR